MSAAAADLDARLAELTLRDEHRLRGRLKRLARIDDDAARGAELQKIAAEIERAAERVARRAAAVPAIAYPEDLPVSQHREELLAAIRDHQVVVVAGETGSGKTTQLPKICLELGRGVRGAIAHTQPRRIAARSVAERIAQELGVPLGEAVGYAVRFTDRSRADTLVRLMTDGLLLAEIQHDRLLRRYDTIIVDEAHERSLNIDFLLGYVKSILPRRPDLKLVITSATIDPQRFAAHFGPDVPVVEVSGRTYPVEIRYRPVGDPEAPDAGDPDRDRIDAIGDAVDELLRERRGDVLVFLSGEREIRDTAEALEGRFRDLEILPLYARLSSAEQQRVMSSPPGRSGRRVVLATNVAETSITVPGIRSVVDPGTARISRYSARLKVQRLPIEPISQASADQRAGRCGRVEAGVCIRLYDEEDYRERPRFTDPEILRTNLASVILQMAAIGLGPIEDFPFLDPPDRRQIRDGINLLTELGALDGDRLTPLGRRLAQLPVDPRLGRMILEAGPLGCADEVIVIAAALSIQDPRERPVDKQAQADQLHARFRDEHSDFTAILNLWRYLGERQRELSGNQFRRLCRDEYLHFLRVREWQDLVGQLRAAARGVGVTINRTPAEPEEVHVALLSGLLSHVGMRDERRPREYVGARNTRFALWPGSGIARRPPSWVMVAELVETSRLFGRTAAWIDPRWVEPLAGHLLKRSYSEPRWDRRRAAVVATERVTLYGLPVVAGRTVAYGRIDPELSRELFIRRALVEGEWDARHRFLAENRALVEEVERMEERARRRDLLVDDQVLVDFFDARIPQDVVSGRHFDHWWRDACRRDPTLLTYPRELLIRPEAAATLDDAGRPTVWRQGELELRLSYRFDPGSAHDGVTVHIPLRVLGEVRDQGFDWLVPAFRVELVTELLRSLPKDARRRLVPIPDVAAQVVERLKPRRGRIVRQIATLLGELRGVQVAPEDFDASGLPAHLRMTFRVEDGDGRVLAEGQDLEAVRAQLRPRLQAELGAASRGLERTGLRAWEIGTLPREVTLPGTGGAVRAYPALVDEGQTVGVRVLDSPQAQAAAMWAGTRRLLLLTIPSPAKWVTGRLSPAARLTLATAPYDGVGAVIEDATAAAVDELLAAAGGPAWDEAGFAALRDRVAGDLAETTLRVMEDVVAVLDARREAQRALDEAPPATPQESRLDVARQLGRLVYPGFVARTGARRLPDVARYLAAAARRIERLPSQPGVDLDRMRVVHELEALHRAKLDGLPAGAAPSPALREIPWLLEELRVASFAQGVGVKGGVSAKRVRRAIAEA
ncbi:MAG: ATP-dependent RNA helicase HrpA [Solirubrobacteraceae bacterium]|nr:ATP-dependent RNA helicase HrpA [Solirubrobacteraceae bacterium]